MMNKEVTLPSGNKLVIGVPPFAVSKALFQAVCEEAKGVKVEDAAQVENIIKDLMCVGLSSKKIEACLSKCFERVLYNGLKMDENTFEPVENRADYLQVCYEVAKENILPFTKSLYAEFSHILATVKLALG